MIKKEFQRRFGEEREKYLGAKNLEKMVNRYLSKYGYKIVFYVTSRILTKEKEKINLETEIQAAEGKLEDLKASRN